MNDCSPTHLLLITIAALTLPLNTSAAQQVGKTTQELSSTTQVFPPAPKTESIDPDPVTDADFYLQKSAAKIAELQTFVDSLRNNTSLQQFPYRPVMYSKRDVQQAIHTLDLAQAQIDLLPERIGGDKRFLHERLTRRVQRLDNYLQVVRTSLLASLDPQAFPDLKTDAVRFRGFGIMLANLDSFKTDPNLAATIYRQLPNAAQEVDRIAAKYDRLIRQETIAGMQLAGLDRYFKSKRQSFLAIAKQQQQALPKQIKDSLEQISNKLKTNELDPPAQQGSEASVDLRTQLRTTKADLQLMTTLDPQAAEFLKPQLQQLLDLQVRLQTTKPSDSYTGNDRDELLKALTFSNLKPVPTDLRIPSTTWTRRTYWQYNGLQWQQTDQSVLTCYVLATIVGENTSSNWQPHLFTKDHLNNEAISVRRIQ